MGRGSRGSEENFVRTSGRIDLGHLMMEDKDTEKELGKRLICP